MLELHCHCHHRLLILLTLKAQTKIESEKMKFSEVVCCKYLLTLLTNSSTEANNADPDQTAPMLHFLNKGLLKHLGR